MRLIMIAVACAACGGGIDPGGTGGGSGAGGNGAGGGGSAASDQQALSGTRLKARYLVGDDGSKQFSGFRDAQRNEDCAFSFAKDGLRRCLPTETFSAPYFEDSSCSQPVVYVAATEPCRSAKYAVTRITNQCPARATYYSLGSSFTPQMIYAHVGTQCMQAGVDSSATFFRIGSEIAPTEFVLATEIVEP